jgi:hypothetical protein
LDDSRTSDGRIGISFEGTVCGSNPGSIPFGESERFYQLIGPFQNPTADLACTSVTMNLGDCVNGAGERLVHGTAYTVFDPGNINDGYLGQAGADMVFQFFLEPSAEFFVVGQQIQDIEFGGDDAAGCVFSATVEIGTGTCG